MLRHTPVSSNVTRKSAGSFSPMNSTRRPASEMTQSE